MLEPNAIPDKVKAIIGYVEKEEFEEKERQLSLFGSVSCE
jgi:hypothetical protein